MKKKTSWWISRLPLMTKIRSLFLTRNRPIVEFYSEFPDIYLIQERNSKELHVSERWWRVLLFALYFLFRDSKGIEYATNPALKWIVTEFFFSFCKPLGALVVGWEPERLTISFLLFIFTIIFRALRSSPSLGNGDGADTIDFFIFVIFSFFYRSLPWEADKNRQRRQLHCEIKPLLKNFGSNARGVLIKKWTSVIVLK